MPPHDPFLVPSYDLFVRAVSSDSEDHVAVTVAAHHPMTVPLVGHRIAFEWGPVELTVTEVTHFFGARHRVRVYVEPVGELPCGVEELSDWLQQSAVVHAQIP